METVVTKKMGLLEGVCDAVNITDNQTAIVRMSSAATCAHVCQATAMEPVMQMTCRDRNRLAQPGRHHRCAVTLGVRNVLCLSGDHQVFGNHATPPRTSMTWTRSS